jgi:DnaD/phage-associated family protein
MTDTPFAGFSNSGLATAVPNVFFSRVLPEIGDAAELVVTAYVFFAAGQQKGRRPRFVTLRELEADAGLVRALANLCGGHDGEVLRRGIEAAVRRGTLVRAAAQHDGTREELLAVNTPPNRTMLERLAGEGVRLAEPLPPAPGEAAPDIFTLYEDNIGAITPLIADDLRDAEQRYPAEWVRAAIREAAELNARSWRYVSAILKRWETEGRGNEKHGRDPEAEWLARRYREGKRARSG